MRKCIIIIGSCLFSAIFIISCESINKNISQQNDLTLFAIDSFENVIQLQETFKEESDPEEEFSADKLKRVQENTKRINSIKNWSLIDEKELWETSFETLEGGLAKFYYKDGRLEKIVTRMFGETFQQITEYYLLNEQLSFVFEKSYIYNRPVYYDSVSMKENNDNEVFELEKSKMIEDRTYFENGKRFHHTTRETDVYSPFDDKWFREEYKSRIAAFEELMKLAKSGKNH